MAGLLPGTRPLAANYGPTLVDDKPVEDPERELGATQVNAMRDDVAYVARLSPLLKIQVSNNGVVTTVTSATGPEGDLILANITAVRTGVGLVTVDWSAATSIAGTEVTGITRDPATPGALMTTAPAAGSTSVAVVTGGGAIDCDFTIWVI
jgi:hypothetical protein